MYRSGGFCRQCFSGRVRSASQKEMAPQALLQFEWDRQKLKAEFVSKEVDKKRLERRIKNKKY